MTGRSAPLRACRVLLGALAVAAGCFTGTASAQFVDHAQQPIPNSTASADANIAPGGLPGCRDGVVGAGCRLLAEPSVDPVPATIGSPNAPEDDLAAALSDLQGATTGADADAAAARARAILVGARVAGRAYSGIPLLNWNARTKVQTVPATPDTEVT